MFAGKAPDSCNKSVSEQIAKYCKTTYGKTYGMTLPINMDYGINYAIKCGYLHSDVNQQSGTYYPKFSDVEGSLRSDRPIIMGVNADGIGALDHYVVIVGARKQQELVLGKWKDRGWIAYKCNWGWGTADRWIYAKESKGDPNEKNSNYNRHSTYRIWLINLAR